MEERKNKRDFGEEKMVEHDCFLLAYHISDPSYWRENGEENELY